MNYSLKSKFVPTDKINKNFGQNKNQKFLSRNCDESFSGF